MRLTLSIDTLYFNQSQWSRTVLWCGIEVVEKEVFIAMRLIQTRTTLPSYILCSTTLTDSGAQTNAAVKTGTIVLHILFI